MTVDFMEVSDLMMLDRKTNVTGDEDYDDGLEKNRSYYIADEFP